MHIQKRPLTSKGEAVQRVTGWIMWPLYCAKRRSRAQYPLRNNSRLHLKELHNKGRVGLVASRA